MKSKTCVITASGKRVCGKPVSRASGAIRSEPSRTPVNSNIYATERATYKSMAGTLAELGWTARIYEGPRALALVAEKGGKRITQTATFPPGSNVPTYSTTLSRARTGEVLSHADLVTKWQARDSILDLAQEE